MLSLTTASAADYLTDRGLAAAHEPLTVRELAGGVSNVVLLVERPGGERLVLKQALPRLRVEQQWLCSIERIWREVEVLRLCGRLLQEGVRVQESGDRGQGAGDRGRFLVRVPEVLFEDRDNYCFAMTAAPTEHRTWKELLLAGHADAQIAQACGWLLGRLHADTWNDAEVARLLDDRTFFRDLRISPYYDRIAEVHADLAIPIQQVTSSIWEHRRCLVHGDFSPKNLLVADGELWLIDFEVGHFGDGAFDLGFFLTHLVLKTLVAGPRGADYLALITTFRAAYDEELLPAAGAAGTAQLWQRTVGALSGCLLARVDGKSPVDYLTDPLAQAVRRTARDLLRSPPRNFDELLSRAIQAAQSVAR